MHFDRGEIEVEMKATLSGKNWQTKCTLPKVQMEWKGRSLPDNMGKMSKKKKKKEERKKEKNQHESM